MNCLKLQTEKVILAIEKYISLNSLNFCNLYCLKKYICLIICAITFMKISTTLCMIENHINIFVFALISCLIQLYFPNTME